jgi:hypothetical protein
MVRGVELICTPVCFEPLFLEAFMDSSARYLFEQILSGDKAKIDQIVDEKWSESEIIDFKNAQSPMTTDDRKNLAEAISGFANSRGWNTTLGNKCM